jgi:hypothetical protein
MRFLFQILFRAKMLIKLCYVNIGLLVTGIGSLYFSSNEPIDGRGNSEGKGSGQEKGRPMIFKVL